MATTSPEAGLDDPERPPGWDLAGSEVPERHRERKEALRARVFSIGDLLHQESSNAEPLLGPIVRRGCRTVLGGFGGAGKSTMALEMVKAIVTGGEFLGWHGDGAKALIIDLEQGISIAQRRVMETFYPGKFEQGPPMRDLIAGLNLGDVADQISYCDWQEGVKLTEEGPDIEVVEELIREMEPDVVMIDPVYKIFLGQKTSEEEVVGAFVQQVDRLRSLYPFALLLPMHPRKPPAQGGGRLSMHDLYGSAMWSWWAETVCIIQRTTGNGAMLRFEKDRPGDLRLEDWTLDFEVGRGFQRLPGDADEVTGASLPSHEKVWRLLQEVGGRLLTRKDIEEVLKMPEKTVRNATERLSKGHANGLYSGLIIEASNTRANRYGFKPSSQALTMEEIVSALNATEEIVDG